MKNRKNIFTIATILLTVSAIHQSGSYIVWLIDYLKETNFPFYGEIIPLLFNCIFLVAPAVMYFVIKSGNKINNGLLYTAIASVILITGVQIMSIFATDPLEAGLPMVIIAIPLTIALSVLSILNLQTD